MATSYSSIRAAVGLSSKAAATAPLVKSSYYPKPAIDLFGPQMAQEIFEYWGEPCETEQACDDYPAYNLSYEPETEYWYQLDLPLENVRDLEERFRSEIVKFQRSYKKMMIYALQWHYLLDECEDNAQVEKMFNDLQMIRKLTGSDKV